MAKNKKRDKTSLIEESSSSKETILLVSKGQLLAKRYRVIERIGTGGMGLVYRAEDEELANRVVALKLLPPELANNEAAIKRLKKEALAAIELHHPHIMAVQSFESCGDNHFLVMEYLDGPDLETSIVDVGSFPLQQTIEIAEQVSDALDYAHKVGVIHRDVKPANLLFTEEAGEQVVKIADFGIAFQVHSSMARVTGQEVTAGTLHYMPPEQLNGEKIDGRADQYALAASVYEMLSGNTPFSGNSIMLMKQIEEKKPEPIDKVPRLVNAILRKALSKNPKERFPTCTAFCESLKNAAASVEEEKKEEVKLKPVKAIQPPLPAPVTYEPEIVKFQFHWYHYMLFFSVLFWVYSVAAENPSLTNPPTPTPLVTRVTPSAKPTKKAKWVEDRTVTINSQPQGAKVYCEDEYSRKLLGTTPIKLTMARGRYHLEFIGPKGYGPTVLKDVFVGYPYPTNVDIVLRQSGRYVPTKRDETPAIGDLSHSWGERTISEGKIVFRVTPKHARIAINGYVVSKEKQNGLSRKSGTYKIKASAKGYVSKYETIKVSGGETTTVELTLVKVPITKPKPTKNPSPRKGLFFRGTQKLNRYHASLIAMRLLLAKRPTALFTIHGLLDVDPAYSMAVSTSLRAGLLQPIDGEFRGEEPLTKMDITVLGWRLLKLNDMKKTTPITKYSDSSLLPEVIARHAIRTMTSKGIITGSEENFDGLRALNRFESMVIFSKIAQELDLPTNNPVLSFNDVDEKNSSVQYCCQAGLIQEGDAITQ